MWSSRFAQFLSLLALSGSQVSAAAKWPSSYDELEDIMLLNSGYRARGLSLPVTPCTLERIPGRVPGAGFIQAAFHDIGEHDIATGKGGLDASLAWELTGELGKDNAGPVFNSTLTFVSRYYSTQASMSDLLALAMYTAVRGCGGPAVPIRTGRKDATGPGSAGLPAATDSTQRMKDKFARMGFNTTDMIKLTACGHTMGSVHAQQFPQIVTPNTTPGGIILFDNTTHGFDNNVMIDYVSGNTINPLVVGPEATNSDKRVFEADGGVTVRQLTDAQKFSDGCKDVLQRMIDVVPSNVQLTEPIQVYDVKPGALRLTLSSDAKSFVFSGEIRIRTTTRPQSSIASVSIVFKCRFGGQSAMVSTTVLGTANGYDDAFTFYGFSTNVDAASSLSYFDVIIAYTDGSRTTYNNNGASFPVEDVIFLQTPMSSLAATADSTGKRAVEVVAAVRGQANNIGLTIALQTPRDIPFPLLTKSNVQMTKQSTIGEYTFYKGVFGVTTAQVNSTTFDLSATIAGQVFSQNFNRINTFGLPAAGSTPSTPASKPVSIVATVATTTTTFVTANANNVVARMVEGNLKAAAPRASSTCGADAGCDADDWVYEPIDEISYSALSATGTPVIVTTTASGLIVQYTGAATNDRVPGANVLVVGLAALIGGAVL